MADLHWDDLRIYLAVARHDSLSAAGRALRIDPATVGRRIARLEQRLGAALFARSPQGYSLTEPGQRLLAHAERAEQAMGAIGEELSGRPGQMAGQIRIGAPDGCANFLLPQVCARIMAEHPDLDLQIIALPRVFNLSRREADLVIGVSPPQAGRLSVQKITDYHLHLAATRDYLDRHPPIRRLEDLRAHRIIGYIPDMIFDKELDYLSALGVSRVAMASNSVSVQFNWLRQGAGLGVVHDFAMPFARDMVRVLGGEVDLVRAFYMIRHADDRRLDRLNRFAALIVEGLRAEVARLEAQVAAGQEA